MSQDTLFLLDPESVKTEGKARFCPDCALIAGYLSFYPAVAKALTVRMIAAPRPRKEIVALLGEDHQGAPVLVLDRNSKLASAIACNEANGYRFIDEPKAILVYLGQKHPAGGVAF